MQCCGAEETTEASVRSLVAESRMAVASVERAANSIDKVAGELPTAVIVKTAYVSGVRDGAIGSLSVLVPLFLCLLLFRRK